MLLTPLSPLAHGPHIVLPINSAFPASSTFVLLLPLDCLFDPCLTTRFSPVLFFSDFKIHPELNHFSLSPQLEELSTTVQITVMGSFLVCCLRGCRLSVCSQSLSEFSSLEKANSPSPSHSLCPVCNAYHSVNGSLLFLLHVFMIVLLKGDLGDNPILNQFSPPSCPHASAFSIFFVSHYL